MKIYPARALPLRTLAIGICLVALAGCDEGTLTVKLTDAPADGLAVFNIAIAGVDIESEDGALSTFTLEQPLVVNVLELRDGNTATLLDNINVPSERYKSVRLRISTDANFRPTAQRADGSTPTVVISDDAARAPVDFRVRDLGSEEILIDLDLRRSVLENDNDIGANRLRFRPRIRAVRTETAGSISGTLGANTLNRAGCIAAVYLYDGHDRTPSGMGGDPDPMSSIFVGASSGASLPYRLSAVAPGDYTVAVTCDALEDDPEEANDLDFVNASNITVREATTETLNFP